MLGLPDDVPSQVTDMLGGGLSSLDCAVLGCWPAACRMEADGLGLEADCWEDGLVSVAMSCLPCRSGCLLPERGR